MKNKDTLRKLGKLKAVVDSMTKGHQVIRKHSGVPVFAQRTLALAIVAKMRHIEMTNQKLFKSDMSGRVDRRRLKRERASQWNSGVMVFVGLGGRRVSKREHIEGRQ